MEGAEPAFEARMTGGDAPRVDGKIRRLGANDIADACRIGQLAPGAARWSEAAYGHLLGTVAEGWVILADHAAAGFIIIRLAADEMEILNFAVLPEFRRQGFGRSLLEAALREGQRRGALRAYLEVRASNAEAIEFYKTSAFEPSGCRPAYYTDPVEDAVLMERHLEKCT